MIFKRVTINNMELFVNIGENEFVGLCELGEYKKDAETYNFNSDASFILQLADLNKNTSRFYELTAHEFYDIFSKSNENLQSSSKRNPFSADKVEKVINNISALAKTNEYDSDEYLECFKPIVDSISKMIERQEKLDEKINNGESQLKNEPAILNLSGVKYLQDFDAKSDKKTPLDYELFASGLVDEDIKGYA